MDPMDDLYEPDEARPAKRVRLEAPLAFTEEMQEDIIDDDDWDDIYSNKATPQKGASPRGGVRLSPEPPQDAIPGAMQTELQKTSNGDAPKLAVNEDDQIVAREKVAAGDEGSHAVLEETSQVEVGSPHKDVVDQNAAGGHNEDILHDGGPARHGPVHNGVDGAVLSMEYGSTKLEVESVGTATAKAAQDPEFMAAAAAQKNDENAEWQFDSSDAESSSDSESDSSSDDSSDDSEDGSEGGYEMLDPATAARMLMSGDGDDDDGEKSKNKTGDHQPRTANEVKHEVVPKPDVVITEDMKITHLGAVDRIVENLALIKAVTPGEYQVLESGSVLCNEKREVIGAVAETLGRVQEPMYSVAFTNAKEIEDIGLEHGSKIFYVDSHSTFVFTQPLKNLKGTDASNIHDEEVGEDEVEFSDDEKEAEYKRLKKAAKRGGRGGLSRSAYNEERAARDSAALDYDSGTAFTKGSDVPQQQYGGLSYDDGDAQDEFYSPLKRPDNLSQLMAGGGPPPMPPRGNFGGRGRGDRGRGRGDRGRGRGGFDRHQRGDRGGFKHNDRGRGNFNQQNGQRGPAHSFPDRHNNGNDHGGRANGRKQHYGRPNSNASQQSMSPPPPQHQPQQQYPPFPPSPLQQSSPQSYQFNGYTFQYGNQAPQQQPQMPAAQATYYNQQQQPPAQNFPPPPQIPAGAYVNPAFFQQQQQQQQPSYGQYPQYQQPAAPQASGTPDLAAILSQLNGYQNQQQYQQR